MNHVTLIGRAGRDAELAFTPSGTPVMKFSMATTRKYKETEQTSWHDVVAFGKTAERMKDLVKKGSEVTVIGEISCRTYADKEGKNRKSVEIIGQVIRVSHWPAAAPETPAFVTEDF